MRWEVHAGSGDRGGGVCARVVPTTRLAGCLGPSELIKKGVTGLVCRNFEADREIKKKSVCFV